MKKFLELGHGVLFSVVIFLIYLIFPIILSYCFKDFLLSDNPILFNATYLGIYFLTFFAILFFTGNEVWKQFKDFLKNPKKILKVGLSYWGYGLLVMFVSNLLVTSLLGNIAVNEQATRSTLLENPISAIPIIIFIGPFLEELIFRFSFRKPFKKKIPYAFFSAFIFGLLHVLTAIDSYTISNILAHASEFLFIVPYGSLGFFFAKAYFETDNIFSSVIPHMLHNSLSVLLILLSNMAF